VSESTPLISIRQTTKAHVLAEQMAERLKADFGHHDVELLLLGLTEAWFSLLEVRAKVFMTDADEECHTLFSAFVVTMAQRMLGLVGVCPQCWRRHGTSEDVVH
jgi:hypothetical protein